MENENNYTVYMHRNKINFKIYIGITCQSVVDRWQNGKGYLKKYKNGDYHQPLMARAILKYGWDNFEHIIFGENLNKEDAEKMERLLIALWDANNPLYGYNIREGGGSLGKASEETRRKMSESQKGKKHTEETKRKLSEISKSRRGDKHPMFGKHFSAEIRANMSAAQKRRFAESPSPMIGRVMSEASKKKMSEARMGKPSPRRRPVYCIELDRTWDCISDARAELGTSHISEAIKGTRKYAGIHPVTGEPLHWKYV